MPCQTSPSRSGRSMRARSFRRRRKTGTTHRRRVFREDGEVDAVPVEGRAQRRGRPAGAMPAGSAGFTRPPRYKRGIGGGRHFPAQRLAHAGALHPAQTCGRRVERAEPPQRLAAPAHRGMKGEPVAAPAASAMGLASITVSAARRWRRPPAPCRSAARKAGSARRARTARAPGSRRRRRSSGARQASS